MGYSLSYDDSIYQKTIYLYLEYWKHIFEESIYILLYVDFMDLFYHLID